MKAYSINQPALPLLQVWLESSSNKIMLTGEGYRPQYIVGMTFNRNADNQGNNVVLDVVDREWSTVEAVLIEGKSASATNIRFQYGWSEIPSMVSPIYQLKIAGWSSTIQPYGTVLRIEGISEICVVGALNEGQVRVWKDKPIHEIVNEIGKKYGYKVDAELTKPIKIKGNKLISTNEEHLQIEQGSMSDLQFIADELTRLAESQKGEGDYVCHIDEANKTIVFKPRKMLDDTPLYDFIYFADKDSDVIEWTAEISSDIMKGVLGSGGTVGGVAINNITGKKETIKLSNSQGTSQKIVDGNKIPVQSNTDTEASQHIKTILPSVPNVSIAKQWNMNTFLQLFNLGGYTAIMKIIGNPRIVPGVMTTVVVYDGNGKLHYTSGRYKIQKVTDVISEGFFYTELNLIKNAGQIGEETSSGRNSG